MTAIYIVRVKHKSGDYFPETPIENTRKTDVINDIWTGQVEDVETVWAFDPEEGWCRDVTEDIAREVLDLHGSELAREAGSSRLENWYAALRDWLGDHLGSLHVAMALRSLR